MNVETTLYNHRRFSIGDKVEKISGDYEFTGIIVGMFCKREPGSIRVVVENSDRILHIFSLAQLSNLTHHTNEHPNIKEQPNGTNIIRPTVSSEVV